MEFWREEICERWRHGKSGSGGSGKDVTVILEEVDGGDILLN